MLSDPVDLDRPALSDLAIGAYLPGTSGKRLLSNPPEGSLAGCNILERFDRDVLATSGMRYMTLIIGIKGIGGSRNDSPNATPIPAEGFLPAYDSGDHPHPNDLG